MTWLRVGDTTWTSPQVQALRSEADPRQLREAYGFLVLIATLSAQHQTDGAIDYTTAAMVGAESTDRLLGVCTAAGMLTRVGRGRTRRWQLVDDPDLLHIRERAAVTWERQQRSDTRSTTYRTACFLRDGDACRWCGKVVQPNDQRSGRGRTLDHLAPGRAAASPDDLVVACRSCNGARGREWQDETMRPSMGQRWRLLPIPSAPYWAPTTISWLAARGHQVTTSPPPAASTPAEEEPRATSQVGPSSAEGPPSTTAGTSAKEEPHATSQVRASGAPHPPPPAVETSRAEEPHPATQAGASGAADTTEERAADARPARRSPQLITGSTEISRGSRVGLRAVVQQPPARQGPDLQEQASGLKPDSRQTVNQGGSTSGRAGQGRGGSGRAPDPPTHDPPPLPPAQPPPPGSRRGRRRRPIPQRRTG